MRLLGTSDGSGGAAPGELYHPHGLALSVDGSEVYAQAPHSATCSSPRVRLHTRVRLHPRPLCVPLTAACTPRGGRQVYVAGRSNYRMQRLRLADGAPLDVTSAHDINSLPYDVALHHRRLYITDANCNRVVTLDTRALGASALASFGRTGERCGELDRTVASPSMRRSASPRLWQASHLRVAAGRGEARRR